VHTHTTHTTHTNIAIHTPHTNISQCLTIIKNFPANLPANLSPRPPNSTAKNLIPHFLKSPANLILPAKQSESPPAKEVKKSRALWDEAKDGFLILQLVQVQRLGKRADNSFKRSDWEDVTRKLNEHFQVSYNRDQLKSRLILVSLRWVQWRSARVRARA